MVPEAELTHDELPLPLAFSIDPVAVICVIPDAILGVPIAVCLLAESMAVAALAVSGVELPSEPIDGAISL